MNLQVYPVGCTEGNTTCYVDVAAESKEGAEKVITNTRPRLTIIHIGEASGDADVDRPKVIGVRAC